MTTNGESTTAAGDETREDDVVSSLPIEVAQTQTKPNDDAASVSDPEPEVEAAVRASKDAIAADGDDEDEDEDPLPLPEDGQVLSPGDYLVELETILPCKREWLVEGFRQIGFSEVLLDQHPAPREKTALVREHCLIGRLTRPVRIKNQSDARWLCARRLKLNVLADLRGKIVPYALVPGKTYECRFLSRMKSQPTREMVEADLDEMGWDVLKLSALRRDIRVEGRDKTSVTLWFGILVWEETESYITEEDPFYFDDVVEI